MGGSRTRGVEFEDDIQIRGRGVRKLARFLILSLVGRGGGVWATLSEAATWTLGRMCLWSRKGWVEMTSGESHMGGVYCQGWVGGE